MFPLLVSLLASCCLATTIADAAEGAKEWSFAIRLISDKKARRVGDLLTVIISEETQTSKSAKSATGKKSGLNGSVSFGMPRMDDRPTAWTNAVVPSWSIDANRTFEGSGSAENSERFTSKIAVRVMEVLPNGNLLIEGKRTMIIQEESVEVILTGTVRTIDIRRNNTIDSSYVADTAIKYLSSGPIVRNQRMGLVTRMWNWLNPF